MYKPRIKWTGVFSVFGEWPHHKMQWCVISTDPIYKLDPNALEKDPRVFGHGDTVQAAWEDYLQEIVIYEEFLSDCEEE